METDNNSERSRRKFCLLNETAFKQFCLEKVAVVKPHHKFERISQSYVDQWHARLMAMVTDDLRRLPSKGKTIK